jgi:nitrite reductase/ring-hydroxylating ferredoxin subunit
VASLVNVHPDSAFIGTVWSIVPVLGVAYLLKERRYFLPVWFVAVAFALGKSRFTLTVGSLVVAVFLLEVVGGWLKRESSLGIGRRGVVTFTLVLIATVGLSGGAMYATSDVDAHAGSPSLPQFIDRNDVEAMNWVESNTDRSATFVVQGDAAEWFPQQTHRTMLVGPWGVEWKGHEPYNRQLELYRGVSSCNSATCMTQTLSNEAVQPNYIYLPKGKFTVRGMQYQRTSQLAMSMHLSPRYQTVFENDGVIIFEMVDAEGSGGEDGSSSDE